MTVSFAVSVKPSCVGRSNPQQLGGNWVRQTFTPTEFVQFAYVEGRATTAALLSAPERRNENWSSSQVVMVDIDSLPDGVTLADVMELDIVRTHAAAVFPSSGFTPAKPKLHLLFVLDTLVRDMALYRMVNAALAARFPFPVDASGLRPVQAMAGTRFRHLDQLPRLDDGWAYANDNAQPLNVYTLSVEAKDLPVTQLPPAVRDTVFLTQTEGLSPRAERHLEQPDAVRLRVTLEALSYALRGWGRRSYDDWLTLWMGAWYGCNGHEAAMNAILEHPDVEWGDPKQFIQAWTTYTPMDGGITVASLFMLARRNGWLQDSPADVTDYIPFYEEHVDGLLSTLNWDGMTRRLIMSGTGSGKTLGTINLLNQMGVPPTVFFAPSIKLCVDLHAKLVAHGVDATLYIDGNRRKSTDELADAQVLVTTLQTFALKVFAAGTAPQYEVVVMDESDELLTSFVRSDTASVLGVASHVSREQSEAGLRALEYLLRTAKHVIFLDGTATEVSRQALIELSPVPVEAYRNGFKRRKANVTVLNTLNDARFTVLEALRNQQRVVVIADTKAECHRMREAVQTLLDPADVLTITSETHADDDVQQFFADVEQGAAQYPCVIYNSSMGSGVSIATVRPDVVVQIAGFLTPRKQLQMLNRYRQQGRVYIYIPPGESLYNESLRERRDRYIQAAETERETLALAAVERNKVGQLAFTLATLAITDEVAQKQATRDFYIALLRGDGRTVFTQEGVMDDEGAYSDVFTEANRVLREQKDLIRKTWRNAPPLRRGDDIPAGTSTLDVARGLLHQRIRYVLRVPDHQDVTTEYDDEDIADLVNTFARYVRVAETWLEPERAIRTTVLEMADDSRSTLTFRLYVGRLELLGLIGILFPTDSDVLTDETLHLHAPRFVREIELRKAVYDTTIAHADSRFDKLLSKHDKKAATDRTHNVTSALALDLAKAILDRIGLKLKRRNGGYRSDGSRLRVTAIQGADDLIRLITLRGVVNAPERLSFDSTHYYGTVTRARDTARVFNTLKAGMKRDIVAALRDTDVTFASVVDQAVHF